MDENEKLSKEAVEIVRTLLEKARIDMNEEDWNEEKHVTPMLELLHMGVIDVIESNLVLSTPGFKYCFDTGLIDDPEKLMSHHLKRGWLRIMGRSE